jgi:hypothetical protein
MLTNLLTVLAVLGIKEDEDEGFFGQELTEGLRREFNYV